MKYQSVTLPDLPYKQLFKSYCQDHYLPFLKDFKPLQYKYDKYKDDLDKGIDKLVNYNNELIINRIKLFLSRLYVPTLRYDSSYNKFYLLTWNNYQNQLASKQADILSNNYRKFIINFLKKYDLIIVDEFYYSLEDEQFAGSKSKGYSLHPKLYSSVDVDVTTDQLTIPKNVYNAFNGIGEKYKHKFDNYPDEVLEIKDMLQGWNLDNEAIPEELKESNRSKIEAYQEPERWFTYSGHGSRVHCQTGNLPTELRPYLKYDDSEVDNFIMFDISNGQPFFLSILMIRELLNLNDEELQLLHDFCLQLQLKGNKEFIANELSKLILHVRKQPYEVDEFLKNVGEKYNDIPIKEELHQLFEDHSQQVLLWCIMASSGCFYEVMQKGSNGMFETREDLKDGFTSVLNYNNEMFTELSNHDLLVYLNNCFPEIYDYIKRLKGNEYRNYAHQTNLIESKFMIKYLAQELLISNIPFVPIHDGIMFPESNKFDVEVALMRYKNLELSVPYRFEDL